MYVWLGIAAIIIFFAGIRIVRPTHRGVIERLGKYVSFAEPGFHWIFPIIYRMVRVNVTEQMVDAERQEIITNDNLNATVDAQVYFKVKSDENNVKNSQYSVNDYETQIVSLARTTLRNIIGEMTLKEANSRRDKINDALKQALASETKHWGLEIVRTELKEIEPPSEVQDAMNQKVIAENGKLAAADFATAVETKADGERRAQIKQAEGRAKAVEVEAKAKADAIRIVNKATEETFKEKAQVLRKLEAVEKCLSDNTKIVLPSGEKLVNVIGDLAGLDRKKL